ncbi:LysE family translocator [Flavobacteriaceae bacterium]|jgi:threonine/homoserine/homoserine lactone efflux protein|nr:LysE family translocator [Flavobacteriaceae bacterium]MDB2612910.1 LysE family translocator [Flavobacteriaceae bacterium]MDC0956414.1 LysE family transporter [Flavobacteriaceae bacterium]MDC1051656.1 LysE family transporter [Flavobacteriaceae bacterium]MDC3242796.1 LysE family translocator [Flavobacteriaceae bacterium]|tara:strand:- start:9 stop:677 length:669 start_codon:yes stop_codon:yes gene_type:complete
MIDDIQAAIPLGFFLSFMIGPVFFVLIETSVTKGFRAAVVFDLGVIIADVFFIALAYFSSFQLLENLSNQPGLFVFGGMIITVYGIIIFLKKPKKASQQENEYISDKKNYLGMFIKGFLINFINIGVLVFWLGIIIITGPTLENNLNRFVVFFSTMIGVYFFTDLVKILLAKQLKKKLTPTRIVKVKKILGFILVICGLVLIIKGFLPKDQLNPQNLIEDIR